MDKANKGTEVISVRVPALLKKRLDHLAQVQQRPRNAIVVDAVLAHLSHEIGGTPTQNLWSRITRHAQSNAQPRSMADIDTEITSLRDDR